jgi:hypothetical protein
MPSVLTPELRAQIDYCIREQFARVRAQEGVKYPTYRPLVSPTTSSFAAVTGDCSPLKNVWSPFQLTSIIPKTPAGTTGLITTDLSIGTYAFPDWDDDDGLPDDISGIEFSVAGTYLAEATCHAQLLTGTGGTEIQLGLDLNGTGITGGIEVGHSGTQAPGFVAVILPVVVDAGDVLTLWFLSEDTSDVATGKLIVHRIGD